MDLLTVKQKKVRIAAGVLRQLEKEAKHEADKGGYECVGLLASQVDEELVSAIIPMRNHSSSPTNSFWIEPWDQFRAENTIDKAGMVCRGVWHSHPNTDAVPSGADETLARPGQLMVIHSVRTGETQVYEESDEKIVMAELVEVSA